MKKLLLIFTVIFTSGFTFSQNVDLTIPFNGTNRTCVVHLPSYYSAAKNYPLVIAFHGMYNNPAVMEDMSGLSIKAESDSFIVVYPRSADTSKVWQYADTGSPNDVNFTSQLLDTLKSKYKIDTMKVFATGFSSGGMMCYKLAYKLANKIAAIASVGGPFTDTSTPSRRVPVIHFHAKNDASVSYGNVQPALDFWIGFNFCGKPSQTILSENGTTGVKWVSTVNSDVILYSTDIGGHSWPGGKAYGAAPSTAINATDLIWNFFKQNPFKVPAAKPSSPVNLTVTIDPQNKLTLNWTDNAENEVGFKIQRKVTDSKLFAEKLWKDIVTLGQNTTSFVDSSSAQGTIFVYRICSYNSGGASDYSNEATITITDVETIEEMPSDFKLFQNYPNPFNPSTQISYRLSAAGRVSLKVYDILGKETATLVNEVQQAGMYSIEFRARKEELPSGVYFYTLTARSISGEQTNDFISTKKMILMK